MRVFVGMSGWVTMPVNMFMVVATLVVMVVLDELYLASLNVAPCFKLENGRELVRLRKLFSGFQVIRTPLELEGLPGTFWSNGF